MTNITESQILEELQQYLDQRTEIPDDGTFTTKELSAAKRISVKKALALIRKALSDGVIEHHPTVRLNVIGQEYTEKYAWRLKKQE